MDEFRGWLSFYQKEPFGAQRDDIRIAALMALYANAHRGKDDEALTPYDFLMFKHDEEVQDGDDVVYMSSAMNRFMKEG